MKRTLPFAVLALVPAVAFALDYADVTDRYTDAPFNKAETAGISVLTEIGAVSGNPDGTFAPNRTLNRAEFLKIAYMSDSRISVGSGDAANCFPDVKQGDWFSKYVCLAKTRGDVGGYPDGTFKPGNAVNYAEALKMLGEIYDIKLSDEELPAYDQWYVPYREGAIDAGVNLKGMDGQMDHLLTRGEMARLTAAYVAHAEGTLEEYRAFERGEVVSPASSSSSTSSSISSIPSTSSTSSSSSAQSSSSSVASFQGAVSRFLVAGETTPVIFDGLILSPDEDATLSLVELELRREIKSLEALILVDSSNNTIATLTLQSYSNPTKLKWRADVSTGSYVFPKGQSVRVGLKAKMKTIAGGAVSAELVELRTLGLYLVGKTSFISRQVVPTDTHYPFHHTAFGRITGVHNDLATSLTVPQGMNRQIGTFTVSAKAASGAAITMESLTFIIQSTDVTATNLRMGSSNPNEQGSCATESFDGQLMLTCFVPDTMRGLTNPIVMNIYGDLTIGGAKQAGSIRLSAKSSGGIGSIGAVRWSDQSGTFNWVENDIPLESGPVITVTK